MKGNKMYWFYKHYFYLYFILLCARVLLCGCTSNKSKKDKIIKEYNDFVDYDIDQLFL